MKLKITLFILLFCNLNGFSQKRVADKFYTNYAYLKAAELYELAIKRGDESAEVLRKLGDCYYNNSNSKKALYWYNLAAEKEKLNDEYIYKYAQSLKSLGKYKDATTWLKKIKRKKKKSRSNLFNYYEELKYKHQDTIKIENIEVNTKNSDFGAYKFNDKLFFSSAMNAKGKMYSWNNQPYLDLYESEIISNGKKVKFKETKPITSEKINTNFHESSIAITQDGKTMYFTRNNLNKRNKLDYDKEGTSHLKIFKATLINGNWTAIKELPFNDEVYSTGHPALSPDEKTLYFTSNKPEGYGETDLYKVAILNNGTSYGTPENLGEKINTKGREMFPFVAKDSTLYFSSDGYENLGFLDIFKSDILKNNKATIVNMGAPFNSGDDDFSFFIEEDNKAGYFSSNRPKGKGNDDIYRFTSIKCTQIIKGKTYDEKTKELLPQTLVQLIDVNGKVIDSVITQKNAAYEFKVDCKSVYTLRGTKKDYKDALAKVKTTQNNNDVIQQDLYLKPLIIQKEIVINSIYFDFDKWDVRPDAAFELEGIVDVLKNNPKMVIKIESHTDSRGKDAYNMILSDRRAKATRDYIVSRNIAPERIQSAIGYGESKLINKCKNGVKCTEEEHQENRRSKFLILKR